MNSIPDPSQCDDASEGAAVGLLGLMTGLSEECWCAGWMSGLEFDLWRAKPGTRYGQGVITERQWNLLRLLSDECGGWWRLDETACPAFVPIKDWLKIAGEAP